MNVSDNEAIPLNKYEEATAETDRFSQGEFIPLLLGLYGEVGSIMSTSKKYRREKKAYLGYKDAVEEEFGDALWYFAAICRRVGIHLDSVFESAITDVQTKVIAANNNEKSPITQIVTAPSAELDTALMDLGGICSDLFKIDRSSDGFRVKLIDFARVYLQAIQSVEVSFSKVVRGNLHKTLGRFSKANLSELPDFDEGFPEEEQLPRKFKIDVIQRKSGQCYLRWNGVFIGAPLTDNIRDPDGYRFHDVFHLAFAAILHWSPTFRALIKHKRKSEPSFDEAQDSGRAIVVEEGLSAWIFSYSKGLEYFEGHDSISLEVLKTIQKFVQGYEVDRCPLNLWEQAILSGYEVFRKIRANNGGTIVGDREARTIKYLEKGLDE